jgi:mannose-6-phosphate isomerase-like protein (cupin superfamily)
MQARQLPETPDVTAPDGSDVRILCDLKGGSMAHFSLDPGKVSKAVMHRTVEEIWYIIAGEGEMWRADSRQEMVIALRPGLSLTIPVGTSFQFRSTGPSALEAVAITMPPWPGEDEAVLVKGVW